MSPTAVDLCVESLCQLGCVEVRQVIRRLETGEAVAEADALSEAERAAVLRELCAIMAVYGDACRI